QPNSAYRGSSRRSALIEVVRHNLGFGFAAGRNWSAGLRLDSSLYRREVSIFKIKKGGNHYGDTDELGGLGRQSQRRERDNESGARRLRRAVLLCLALR